MTNAYDYKRWCINNSSRSGELKNYFICNGDNFVELTNDLTCTINSCNQRQDTIYMFVQVTMLKREKASLRAVTRYQKTRGLPWLADVRYKPNFLKEI
jgi:hypothetical protein